MFIISIILTFLAKDKGGSALFEKKVSGPTHSKNGFSPAVPRHGGPSPLRLNQSFGISVALCWPKFKTGILERAKVERFGRAKPECRYRVKGRGAFGFLIVFLAPDNRAPDLRLSRLGCARLRRLARRLARPVAPGVATVATPKSTRRDKPFPSARCVSASETTEATGDPYAPLVRPSAPAVSARRDQKRYLARILGTTGFVGSGRSSRT